MNGDLLRPLQIMVIHHASFFYLNFRETYIHVEKMRDLMLYVRRRQCCLILNRLKLPFMGFFHFYKNTILVFMD